MKRVLFLLLFIPLYIFPGKYFKYRVEKNDTLNNLSIKFNITIDELKESNDFKKDILYRGQLIYVPPKYNYIKPKKESLENILSNSIKNWRNSIFELYSWSERESILILDTYNYSIQSLMFKRLAYFIEKDEYAGKIYPYIDVEDKKGWNGHDYRGLDLARFFNRVERDGLTLTRGEEILLEIIIRQGIIKKTRYGYRDGGGAILSISRGSSYNLRKVILRHEVLHGLYFTSPELRVYGATVWNTIPKRGREIWKMYLKILGYDISNRDLVINEFVAYTLQGDENETNSYFKYTMYYRLVNNYPEKRVFIDSFYKVNRKPYSLQIGKLRKFVKGEVNKLY